jgi:hypothetical protein
VTTSTKPTINPEGVIPLPPNATVPLFYKYSSWQLPSTWNGSESLFKSMSCTCQI